MGKFKSQAEAEAAGVYISKIKSYVKREGRLTQAQQRALLDYWPTIGVDYTPAVISLDELFKRNAPTVLEIGFGMGKSLVAMAASSPQTNFIGIEVHRPGVGACLAEAGALNLSNLKVFEYDAVDVLKHMIPDNSLHRLQLFFPDPWHKKRHHKRRIVQTDFADLVAQKLHAKGQFHMATDWEPYAEHMLNVMDKHPSYCNIASDGLYVPRPEYRPTTKFETRGQKLGHGVWDIIYERKA